MLKCEIGGGVGDGGGVKKAVKMAFCEWCTVWMVPIENYLADSWSLNHFYYILRLFDVLPNFLFTISEMILGN